MQSGYVSVSQVTGPGEFALRGSLFDVFPMGQETPVRVDLLDDRIDSIRRFDPDSQRSLERLEQLELLPARELPLDAESVKAFRRRYRTRFDGDVTRMPIYRGVSEGIAPPGIEFYLPLFFDTTAQIADYLPAQAVIASDLDLESALERGWEAIGVRYEDRRHDIERPLLPPAEAFLPPEQIRAALQAYQRVTIERFAGSELPPPDAAQEFHYHRAARVPPRCARGRAAGAADGLPRRLHRPRADRRRLPRPARGHRRDARRTRTPAARDQQLGRVRRRRCAARHLRGRGSAGPGTVAAGAAAAE